MNIREKMKKDLEERNKEAEKTNSAYGSGFTKDILKDDIKKWKCKEGDHLIDIIPYQIGANHPNPKFKEGDFTYYFDLFVHRDIGINKEQVVCLKETSGKPCPICEYRTEMMKGDDFDVAESKKLSPKKRTLYNIVCYDSDEEQAKGIQIFNVAWFYVQNHLVPLTKNKRTGANIPFTDPDEGKSLSFTRIGMDAQSKFVGHSFVDRCDASGKTYTISDEILDSVYKLEDIISFPTYEEVESILYGKPVESVKSTDTTSPMEEKKIVDSSPNSDDSNDDSNEVIRECEYGYNFGVDFNKKEECEDDCDLWEECRAKRRELRKVEGDNIPY